MEMKDIAMLLCNLPEGNYNVETEIGNVEISSVWANERINFRIINILINGKIYDEITYTHFDYFKLYEKINFKNNGKSYKLMHHLVNLPCNEINYINDNGDEYEITSDRVTNKSKNYTTYDIKNGVCISQNKNIRFTYDLETSEKLLYIKRFDCEKDNATLENDYICINKTYDYEGVIFRYNQIIEYHLNEMKKSVRPIKDLISCLQIRMIDIEEVRRLEKEIDEYVQIYKEFAPKLNQYHSEKMLKILEYVATTLSNKYNAPKQEQTEQQNKKVKKLFDISKFKNK